MVADPIHIRLATPDNLTAIRRIIDEAYGKYIPAMDKPPGPMLDNYPARIAAHEAYVTESADLIIGVLILLDREDYLLLDNVAVSPAAQGTGAGKRMVAFAEAEASRRGFKEIRLYTHIVMSENIGFYESLGWQETHRGRQDGYDRVFMRKALPDTPQ